MHKYLTALLLLGILLASSCTKDKLPAEDVDCPDTYTYVDDAKAIIDLTCAYAGCHVAGFGNGDHSSYSTLLTQLDNRQFFRRVIDRRDMPPDYAPADRQQSLTQEQLDILTCWLEAGHPEQ